MRKIIFQSSATSVRASFAESDVHGSQRKHSCVSQEVLCFVGGTRSLIDDMSCAFSDSAGVYNS